MPTPPMIPLAGPGATGERRDAVRNRELLLAAAERLITERGVAAVSMDDVAQAAGVGKGTVFRRFGSRAGLLQALLDRDETDIQRAFMFGPPPQGPGGPPVERLIAFGHARLRMIARHGDLLVGAEQATSDPFAVPAWRVSSTLVHSLLTEAGFDGDLDVWTGILMSTLSPLWTTHQIVDSGVRLERLEAGWTDLVRRTLTS
ncbi:helix-turn-helix domain containing protein [Tsukamurella sp. 8F]|uniref:TetR/AcrR family transcriptional regulator n=1 Tax=unclassified Tsukamurella TaxID=2633480 RepID=UPI0023B9CC1B|nr:MULTISPECIES: TetR/AcrR family transcriptional regulator [unclassified Tsukamurella]MDF0529718.1 helix-turn-helix domain containing protein [Tsukamurella sp. 8J]MDF0586003.1 helix-turn-helix domain containing protein [Tsukamurella sp. 8F]